MKTKFIKFNKLPKLETLGAEQQHDSNSRNHLRDIGDVSSGPFNKSETQKYNQLL